MTTFTTTTADQTVAARAETHRPGLVAAYMELTKVRLNTMVLIVTAVSYILADRLAIDWPGLVWTILGTGLAAGCASGLNQILERRRDKRMARTRDRPLPSGRISVRHAYILSIVMGYAGIAILGVFVNLAAAGLALLTILLYVCLYTPMKPRTSLNTIVGAICGALPPVLGWVAATGTLSQWQPGAWALGAVLFVWQLPHFLALAWMYQRDYRRGGYKMLPVVERSGELTARIILLTSMLLLPVGLTVALAGVAGWMYAIGSVMLGLVMTVLAARFYFQHTYQNARQVFFASLIYLPILMLLLLLDSGWMDYTTITDFSALNQPVEQASPPASYE